MTLPNILGGCALFLSVTAIVLAAVAGIVPNFVDVYVVEDPNNPDSGEPFASVGVFSAIYDSSVVSDELLSDSGIPIDSFETPTLEFPLLFPGPENFAADVLPFDRDDAAVFAALTGSDVLEAYFDSYISGVEEVEFDDCSTYIDDVLVQLTNYFTFLQAGIFPGAIGLVSDTVAATLNENFVVSEGITANISLGVVQTILGSGATINTAVGVSLCTEGFEAMLESTVDAETSCFEFLLALIDGFSTHVNNNCELTDTIAVCFFGRVSYALDDTEFESVVSFENEDLGLIGACDLYTGFSCSGLGFTVENYIFGVLDSAVNGTGSSAESFLDAYAIALDFGLLPGDTLEDSLDTSSIDSTIPDVSGFVNYDPCLLLTVTVATGAFNITGITGEETEACDFNTYLTAVVDLLTQLENDLASTIEGVSTLYQACAALSFVNADIDCPALFGRIILDGAYDAGLSTELATEDATKTEILSQCEDDLIDSDKIAQGQNSIISVYVMFSVAVLAGIFGLFMQSTSVVTFLVAGLFAFAAGMMSFGALLFVQSAPVYENVGGDVEEGDIFYTNGVVVSLALATTVLGVVSGFTFCAAAGFKGRSSTGDEEEEEEKELPKEKAEVQAAAGEEAEIEEEKAPVTAKAEEKAKDDDIVPGTGIAI